MQVRSARLLPTMARELLQQRRERFKRPGAVCPAWECP
jgi:hypothetical protein